MLIQTTSRQLDNTGMVAIMVIYYIAILMGFSLKVAPTGSLSSQGSIICVSECDQQEITCQEVIPIEDAFFNNVTVAFCDEKLHIHKELQIQNKVNLTLKGIGSSHSQLSCNLSTFSGFKFINVTNLVISNIDFIGCGIVVGNKELDGSSMLITSSLMISSCSNITIDNISVISGTGSGIILNKIHGYVSILTSSFERNCNNKSILSRGSLYVEFTHESSSGASVINNTLLISHSTFHQNNCTFSSFSDWTGSFTLHEDLVSGGGVTLEFKLNASNNNAVILNSNFSQNLGLVGGGLRAHYKDASENNSLVVQNSLFLNNECYYSGGGIGLSFAVYYENDGQDRTRNTVLFQNCTIVGNKARFGQYGGGVRIYSSRNLFVANKIEFSNCFFLSNQALYGSALDILPCTTDINVDGYLSSVHFNNCAFISNRANKSLLGRNGSYALYKDGRGALMCTGFSMYFTGITVFQNNIASALYMYSCKAYFSSGSCVEFLNNSAYADGGAILMFGESVLYAMDNSTIAFINNTAKQRGGAIMSSSSNVHDFLSLKNCFIQYKGDNAHIKDRLLHFEFQGNSAKYGQAIYASTLKPCQRLCVDWQFEMSNWTASSRKISLQKSLDCIGNFMFDDSYLEKQVSTSGDQVHPKSNLSQPVFAIPGQEFNLDFDIHDELSQPTGGTFQTFMIPDGNNSLVVDQAYSSISEDKVMKLYGRPGEMARLALINVEFHPILVIMNVEMKQCFPGYVTQVDSSGNTKCTCSASTINKQYIGIAKCSQDKKKAYINNGYWVGYNTTETEDQLITGYCPRGFCQYNSKPKSKYKLPSRSQLDNFICGQHRTGKLCGSCRLNHSVFFHSSSYECKPNNSACRISIFLYLVSELLPVTILFLIIILFDIQFISGALNSLLLFVQIMDSMLIDVNGIVEPQSVLAIFQQVHQLIYAIFNLHFFDIDGFSFCLWRTATTLDVIAFKYVTITYSLLLVVVTVALMSFLNPCKIRKYSAKQSIIHGLVAFLVICYAQITRVSLLILTPGFLYWMGPANNHPVSKVVYLNGEIPFMGKQHMKYAFPAMLFSAVFTIAPPLLLMVYPLCYRVFALLKVEEASCTHFLCKVIPLEKLKPFYDSFQGCFKDRYRFFAGFYFLYRLSILLCHVVSTDSLTKFYTILEIQFICMLVLHAVIKPYKLQQHNVLDIMLLGLLAVINMLTMYNYQISYREHKRDQYLINIVSAVQTVLSYIPLLCLVVYLLKYFIRKIRMFIKSKQADQGFEEDLMDTLAMVDMRDNKLQDSVDLEYHRFE